MTDDRVTACEAFEEAVGDYADGALSGEARRRVEQHLDQCRGCRALASDLRAIRRTASTLDRRVPSRAVWQRIAAGLAPPQAARPPRRWLMPLAAAAVLTVAVGSAVYIRMRPAPPVAVNSPPHVDEPVAAVAPAAGPADELARTVEAEMQMAEAHYVKAIAGLEQIAKSEEKTLDPNIAATLKKNLTVIDQAISESRAALKTQPDSEPAQASLFDAFRDKLMLLQDTVALINEMRKGNQTEAARIAGGMNKM